MASIFTYETECPRVSSPWLTAEVTPDQGAASVRSTTSLSKGIPIHGNDRYLSRSLPGTPPPGLLSDYGVTKLEPEPQTGPAEYKLHLLLRPRRTYSHSTTPTQVGESQHSSHQGHETTLRLPMSPPSAQMRQSRLEHLTTQLLWRLQQSSPYHGNSAGDLVLPQLPDASGKCLSQTRPGKLLAGLEASRGALYEIGVSDDGTLVGLTEDEMEESLNNLRAMASSLGCNVEIVRMILVGDCEWNQFVCVTDTPTPGTQMSSRHRANLWVAEALVTPNLTAAERIRGSTEVNEHGQNRGKDEKSMISRLTNQDVKDCDLPNSSISTQLRITLTGPTTSGKSSLLGTLSTATLDNGRGKSRLSLLKHRHELATGMTSSVTQELFGYKPDTEAQGHAAKVINYASDNVSSWTDIHASVDDGRLVLVSDSAGHPKYRRTIVRGLVGAAPHWTLLCISADNGSSNASRLDGSTVSAQDVLGSSGVGVDLAKAHLDLCLKLEQPLVVVITKLDLASRGNLRQTLAMILSSIKATGRSPTMIPLDPAPIEGQQGAMSKNLDLGIIPAAEASVIRNALVHQKHQANAPDLSTSLAESEAFTAVVPIIMTSAFNGAGIRMLHGLLHTLPIPYPPTAGSLVPGVLNPEQPTSLFHIEDVFALPASHVNSDWSSPAVDTGTVLAGHLRFGRLLVGESTVVGPFPLDLEPLAVSSDQHRNSTQTELPWSKSTDIRPGSFTTQAVTSLGTDLRHSYAKKSPVEQGHGQEWLWAKVVSIRNLRLPVHVLEAGKFGTVGIIFNVSHPDNQPEKNSATNWRAPRIRKGMVLAIPGKHTERSETPLQAASAFTASFEDGDVNSVTPGSLVVVYIASIRASARVVRLVPHVELPEEHSDDLFGLDEDIELDEEMDLSVFGQDGVTDVTLELITNREWIELGSKVLIMPGGGSGLYKASERGEKGVAGLEGFVGKVIEVVD